MKHIAPAMSAASLTGKPAAKIGRSCYDASKRKNSSRCWPSATSARRCSLDSKCQNIALPWIVLAPWAWRPCDKGMPLACCPLLAPQSPISRPDNSATVFYRRSNTSGPMILGQPKRPPGCFQSCHISQRTDRCLSVCSQTFARRTGTRHSISSVPRTIRLPCSSTDAAECTLPAVGGIVVRDLESGQLMEYDTASTTYRQAFREQIASGTRWARTDLAPHLRHAVRRGDQRD